MRRRASVVLAVIAALAMSVGISSPVLADPPYQIVGTVTDPDGNRVAGVLVTAESYDPVFQISSDETEADGTYVIAGLDEGSFRVWTNVSPYLPFEQYDVGVASLTPSPQVDIALEFPPIVPVGVSSGSISGTVSLSEPGAVASGSISLYAWDGSSVADDTVTFDGSGQADYELTGIPDGEYFLDVSAPGTASQRVLVVVDSDAPDGGDVELDVELDVDGPFQIVGTVLDENGEGVAGVNVSVSTPSYDQYGSDTTDADGHYAIEGLTPATFTVYASSPCEVP